MRNILRCALAIAIIATAAGQQRPVLNDGEMHGDPPFLLEEGWTPLLNGKDISGWHGLGPGQNQWFATTGILWEDTD